MAETIKTSAVAPTLRAAQASVGQRPYDALRPEDLAPEVVADRSLTVGWKRANYPLLRLVPPVDWDNACASQRSWAFLLHAWDVLGPVLAAYDRTRAPRYLEYATSLARDWATAHPSLEVESPFAWYPMAVGLRAYRLAYILDSLARSVDSSDEDIELLAAAVENHRVALADNSRFIPHHNHGFFQAAGQLAMARRLHTLPGMRQAARQGEQRLKRLVAEHFTAEGMHREHSPTYHHAVLVTLQRVLDAGLVRDPQLLAARARIEAALAWLVLPDGSLAPFGDTDAAFHPDLPRDADPHLRYVLSAGIQGEAPEDLVRGFPEAGYAISRRLSPDGFPHSSYLAQICGFHSRTHKHADHLSVVWHERGHDLLVEAGRYGYSGRTEPDSQLARDGFWYSDPNRVYVESTRAHNTVEIDGRSYARRDVTPFGSALRRHGAADGVAYVESHVRHTDALNHTRVLIYQADDWLIVLDTVIDTQEIPHDYRQRFHFAPDLELEALRDEFGLRIPGRAERLYVLPLLPSAVVQPARGEIEPELLGWASRDAQTMTPVWTVAYEAAEVARHTFATLLALANAKPIADRASNRTNVTGRKARLAWRVGPRRIQIDMDREAEELEIRRRVVDVRREPVRQPSP